MGGLSRFWVIFKARNREFLRDRAGFGWNILFPFLLVAGFGIIFGAKEQGAHKIGVFPVSGVIEQAGGLQLPRPFTALPYLQFVGFSDQEQGLDRLVHHRIDLLIEQGAPPYRYWVSETSAKSLIAEKLFLSSLDTAAAGAQTVVVKQPVQGFAIRYIDWLFPGILGMNMMFSALWGVGYVVVRYRKTGVLKRLKATPLTAFEYLSAQLVSRLCVLMFSLILVWIGCDLIFDFQVRGTYLNLFWVFLAGSLSMSALGLLLASRGTSEEFTTGILNFISWPMMFLSEVWFSLEGAPRWVQQVAQIFPLTHLLRAARRVMGDGAGLAEIGVEMTVLVVSAMLFLALGAALFSWNR